jgi:Ca2+-binding RTX toxin-like protein
LTTYLVSAQGGDDEVDATARAGTGLTVLGEGADVFSGGPGFDRVQTGQTSRDGPSVDRDRDVVDTGTGGSVVTTGEDGFTNEDVIVTGASGRRKNTLNFIGVQGAEGRVSFGEGKAMLTIPGLTAAGAATVVDNRRRIVVTDGVPTLSWDGDVGDFALDAEEAAAVSFVGTDADERLYVYFWLGDVTASMGPGGDTVVVGCGGSAPAGSVDFGRGRDHAVLHPVQACGPLDTDLSAHRLLPGIRSGGLEDVLVRYASEPVRVRGDQRPNVNRVLGCSATAAGRGGDDRLVLSAPSDCRRGGARLVGGPGEDTLVGSPFRDRLLGGTGRDLAFGREGVDTCRAEVTRSCERA